MSGMRKCLCECYMRCLKRISCLEYERNEKMFMWMLHQMFEKSKLLRIWAEWENVHVNVTCYVWKEHATYNMSGMRKCLCKCYIR
jgi:hypothetical protein